MSDVIEEEARGDDQAILDALTDLGPLLHITRWGIDAEAWSYRLANDPTFATEMRVCEKYGIPHSEFLGWRDEDRAKALAFHLHEAQRCQGCGIHPLEWPAEADPPPFEATMHHCPACAELDRYKRHIQENTKGKPPSMTDGLKPTLRRQGF